MASPSQELATTSATATPGSALDQALSEVLQKAVTGVEQGVDFLSAQLPDVVHQLLMWKMAESIVYNLLAVGVTLFTIWCWGKFNAAIKEDGFNEDAGPPILICGGAITIITAVFVMLALNLDWLKIWLAPKVYLIEYAASLVK